MEVSGMNATIADDRSSVVIVYAAITIFLAVLFISLRTLIAVKKKIQVRRDDLFIFAAVATSLAQSITWICAAQHGLGRHMDSLSETDLGYYFEFTYSSQVLGIFAMTFSKISVSLLMRRLSIDTAPMLWSGPVASIAIWAFLAILAILFQCKPPNPWNSSPSNCPHRDGIWFAVGSFNIVTDTFLALYVASKIWNLNMESKVRTTVIILFMSRLVVPIVTMLQVSLASRSFRANDFTYGSVDFAITSNVVVHLSLITAIVPRIRLLATPTAIRTAAQPTHHFTHPVSPQYSTHPPQNLGLTSSNISDRSNGPHNRPCSQHPLTKVQSRDTIDSVDKDNVTINSVTTRLDTAHLDTKPLSPTSSTSLSLVPPSTLAEIKTNVYRPYTIASSYLHRSSSAEEIEYARGGFMNVSIVTEPPRVLTIDKTVEVQVEIDDVGSINTNSTVMEQRIVTPRDILKLEQKRNNRRNEDRSFAGQLGWGAGVSFEC